MDDDDIVDAETVDPLEDEPDADPLEVWSIERLMVEAQPAYLCMSIDHFGVYHPCEPEMRLYVKGGLPNYSVN